MPVEKHDSDQMRKETKNITDQMRYNVHKLKVVFVDTIKFAIDKDLVKYLYTLLRLEKIHEKVGIYGIGVNEIMKTENVETMRKISSELFHQVVMIGDRLEDIKLELSYLEIREKYDLSPLLVEDHEDKSDSEKIDHMLILIQHGLDLPDYSDESDVQPPFQVLIDHAK